MSTKSFHTSPAKSPAAAATFSTPPARREGGRSPLDCGGWSGAGSVGPTAVIFAADYGRANDILPFLPQSVQLIRPSLQKNFRFGRHAGAEHVRTVQLGRPLGGREHMRINLTAEFLRGLSQDRGQLSKRNASLSNFERMWSSPLDCSKRGEHWEWRASRRHSHCTRFFIPPQASQAPIAPRVGVPGFSRSNTTSPPRQPPEPDPPPKGA